MNKKQIIVIVIGLALFLSAVLSAVSISQPPAPLTREELNREVNSLVDTCMETLPQGLPECDEQLRDIVDQICQQDPSLDACTDGRVDEYYNIRGMS